MQKCKVILPLNINLIKFNNMYSLLKILNKIKLKEKYDFKQRRYSKKYFCVNSYE